MHWLMKLWSLLLSAQKTKETVRHAVKVARQVQTTIDNAGTAELQELRRRAEQGDRLAQYDLGETYYTGASVPSDLAEAARWFEKSAEQDYVKAQTTLAMLYASGRGVERDLLQALAWAERAAAKNDPSALRLRSKLVAKLSPEQVAQARQIASQKRNHPE